MTLVRHTAIYTRLKSSNWRSASLLQSSFRGCLGPSGRGIVSLAVVLVTLLTVLATFGLATAFAYFGGKRAYRREIVGAMISAAVVLGGACA